VGSHNSSQASFVKEREAFQKAKISCTFSGKNSFFKVMRPWLVLNYFRIQTQLGQTPEVGSSSKLHHRSALTIAWVTKLLPVSNQKG